MKPNNNRRVEKSSEKNLRWQVDEEKNTLACAMSSTAMPLFGQGRVVKKEFRELYYKFSGGLH